MKNQDANISHLMGEYEIRILWLPKHVTWQASVNDQDGQTVMAMTSPDVTQAAAACALWISQTCDFRDARDRAEAETPEEREESRLLNEADLKRKANDEDRSHLF